MVRKQQSIPQVLVIAQFSGITTDIFAQISQIVDRQTGWASRMVPIQQTGKAFRSKPLDPIFNRSGRVSIQASRVTGTGSVQNMQNSMEPMEVASFGSARNFVLDSSLEYLSIRNTCPSHWEPPFFLYSQYTLFLN